MRIHADRFGVEPILTVLTEHGTGIAPSTYYAHQARGFGPSTRDLDDAYAANELYELWKAALRASIQVGRDQVERLMKLTGIGGVRRGRRRTVTTVSDPKAARHPDHVKRQWSWPSRPD